MSRDRLRRAMTVLLVEIERAWGRRDMVAVETYMGAYAILARRHVMH